MKKKSDVSFQRTLKTEISCVGTGLHSGKPIKMRLCPAQANQGIVFRRTDLKNGARDVPALYDRVSKTQLCTVLQNEQGTEVATVEHVMAALSGVGIDNAVIELDGGEVPIMDGSSAPFLFLIQCAGIEELPEKRRFLKVLKPVQVEKGDVFIKIEPNDRFTMALTVDFPQEIIGRQEIFLEITPKNFQKELGDARTFGFLSEVKKMHAAGLALGGSLENAVVVDGDRILNAEGLRHQDEFVRHKALDCVGDLALAGFPVLGHFSAAKTGHEMNNRLLHALLADKDAWMITTGE